MPLILTLRSEQHTIAGETDNATSWFSRQIQLPVRKRVLNMLKKDISVKAKICRVDIYQDWEYYCKLINKFGCVIEAEPLEKLGYIESICFIDPKGEVNDCKDVEIIVDTNNQTMGYVYPQNLVPTLSIEGATIAIAKQLFDSYEVIGYFTVKFLIFWDAFDNMPRLYAQDIQLGFTPLIGAFGTVSVAALNDRTASNNLSFNNNNNNLSNNNNNVLLENFKMPLSLIPEIPNGF
jgi:hypothetical protein